MATTFFTIHHYLAAGQQHDPRINEDEAKQNMAKKDSLAATPILGLAVGTVGLVVAIAGVIFGLLSAFVLTIISSCNKDAEEYKDKAWDVCKAGVFFTAAYPVMMVYGQTVGWFTHTYLFNNPIKFSFGGCSGD